MPALYLTPASISYLTQFILAGMIAAYLAWRLRKPESRDAQSILLAGALTLVAIFIGLLFLDLSLLPTPRLCAVYLENTVLALGLTLLIQFAYHFPVLYPSRKWEARLALAASLGYALYEAGFAVHRYLLLFTQETVEYRSADADRALIFVIAWLPLAFLRQTVCADPRPLPWLNKLLRPQGDAAQALRSFALIYLILPVLAIINLWRATGEVTTALYNIAMSAGVLTVLLLFTLAYINYLPETTSFMIKLSGITLTVLLALLGAVGWAGTPTYIATYQPALQDFQTLRFTPNAQGGYTVSEAPFHFETDLGERLDVRYTDQRRNQVVDFEFPFFGKTYSQIYVTSSGLLSLGAPLYHPNLQNDYGNFPGIFPLLIDLLPTDGNGVYARKHADRLVVTWNRVRAAQRPEWVFTFQTVLYADGRIDFTYNGLPQRLVFDHNQTPSANPWLRGLTPGLNTPTMQTEALAAGAVIGPSGLIQDFHLDFRRYLGRFLNPLAAVALGGSLLILIGLPLLFYSTLIQPLEVLLAGIRKMDKGELGTQLTIKYRDEIGFLTRAFNEIGGRLNTLVNEMETQVAERTADLQSANDALRKLLVAVEQSPSAIIITNPQAEIEYVNPAFTLSTGYLFNEVKGKNPRFLKSGQTPPETFQEMWSTLLAGKTWRGELINRRKNGEIYWEYTVIAPIYDVEGNLTHYVAVKEDITARKTAEAKLEALTITDPLTGLLNRRGFFPQAQAIYARCQRPPDELAALMMDIDHFKNINDRYGHQAGDVVLHEAAARIRDHLRPTDLLARYGGEEFAALLPRTSQDTLQKIAERLNAAIREQPFEYKHHSIPVTISIGGAMLTDATPSLDDLLSQADQAMYRAKAAGRNCAVIFPPADKEG